MESLAHRLAVYLVEHSPLGYSGISEGILADCQVFLSWLREEATTLDIPYHLSELHDDGRIDDAEYAVMKELLGETRITTERVFIWGTKL